jgi:hypothetical protein
MNKTTGVKLTCDNCKKPFGTIVSEDLESLIESGRMLRKMGVTMMCFECSDSIYNKGVSA